MVDRYRNGWWLEEKYHREGLTQREIAEECGVSARTIRAYMNEFDIETRELTGEDHPLHGSTRSEDTKAAIAETLDGRELDEEWRRNIADALTGRRLPAAVREQMSDALSGREKSRETRAKMSKSTAGSANPNWKGGYSRYYGPGWAIARQRIRERDVVCQACGHDDSENRLEVHHIIPVRTFREAADANVSEAHQPSNLILLCNSCHTKADFGTLDFESGIDPPESDDE